MNTTIKIVSNRTVVKFQVSMPGAPGATGQGVPVGGTDGQILNKINSTNYNAQWSGFASLFESWANSLQVYDDNDLATPGTWYLTAQNHKTLPGGIIVKA